MQLDLCSTLSWCQLGGWAAKSIQSSMIHQIGVGICPERLDPAVAGLLTRRPHSRVEALRLETCCTTHRHRSRPSPSLVPVSVCQVRLSWAALSRNNPSPNHLLLPVPETARLPLEVEPQLSVRGANPTVVTRVRRSHWHRDQGPEGLRPTVSSCHFSQDGIPRGTLAGSPAPSLALAYRPLVLLISTLPARSLLPVSLYISSPRASGLCEAAVAATAPLGSSLPNPDLCRCQRSSAYAPSHLIELDRPI